MPIRTPEFGTTCISLDDEECEIDTSISGCRKRLDTESRTNGSPLHPFALISRAKMGSIRLNKAHMDTEFNTACMGLERFIIPFNWQSFIDLASSR